MTCFSSRPFLSAREFQMQFNDNRFQILLLWTDFSLVKFLKIAQETMNMFTLSLKTTQNSSLKYRHLCLLANKKTAQITINIFHCNFSPTKPEIELFKNNKNSNIIFGGVTTPNKNGTKELNNWVFIYLQTILYNYAIIPQLSNKTTCYEKFLVFLYLQLV